MALFSSWRRLPEGASLESQGGRLASMKLPWPPAWEDELMRQQMKPLSQSRQIWSPQSNVSIRVFPNYLPALSISQQSSFVYSVNIAKWPSTDVRHRRRCLAWKAFQHNCWHRRPRQRTYLFSTVVLMEYFLLTLTAECLRSGFSSAWFSGSAIKRADSLKMEFGGVEVRKLHSNDLRNMKQPFAYCLFCFLLNLSIVQVYKWGQGIVEFALYLFST